MSIIKHCQRIEYQRMKKIVDQRSEWDRQNEDGSFLKPAPSHRRTDSTHYEDSTERLAAAREREARTRKNVMFMGDGACRDMFISLHPEDIRAQLT